MTRSLMGLGFVLGLAAAALFLWASQPQPTDPPRTERVGNCFIIFPKPTKPGQGAGGYAKVCGEGSCAKAGSPGGSSEGQPTYCVINGELVEHIGVEPLWPSR